MIRLRDLAALTCLAPLLLLSGPTDAAAPAPAPAAPTAPSACAEPGLTFQWANVPGKGGHLSNDISRSLGGIAIRMSRDNCTIELVCVAGDKTPEAKTLAAERCVLVRNGLFKINKKKSVTRDEVKIKHRKAGGGLMPNMVYLILR